MQIQRFLLGLSPVFFRFPFRVPPCLSVFFFAAFPFFLGWMVSCSRKRSLILGGLTLNRTRGPLTSVRVRGSSATYLPSSSFEVVPGNHSLWSWCPNLVKIRESCFPQVNFTSFGFIVISIFISQHGFQHVCKHFPMCQRCRFPSSRWESFIGNNFEASLHVQASDRYLGDSLLLFI